MSQQTIDEILRRVGIEYGGYDDSIKDGMPMTLKEAHAAILKLIREMVPGEKAQGQLMTWTEAAQWNLCRQNFLTRLEEMERGV